MAAIINIKKPIDAISDFTATLINVAGAGFPVGTYRFCVQQWAETPSMLDYAQWNSPSSNIVEIEITTPNKGIHITWSWANFAEKSTLIISKNGSFWYPTTQGTPAYWTLGFDTDYTEADIEIYGVYGSMLPIFYNDGVKFPFGLNNLKGIGKIEITGSGNVVCNLIENALVASSDAIENEDYIRMYGSGLITTYSINFKNLVGDFNINEKFLWLYGGLDNWGGTSTLTGIGSPKSATIISNPRYQGSDRYVYLNNATLENFELGTNTYIDGGQGYMQYVFSNTSTATNGMIIGAFPRLNYANQYIKTKFVCYELMSLSRNIFYENIEILYGVLRMYNYYAATYRNFYIDTNYTYHFNLFSNYSTEGTNKFIDCTFNGKPDVIPNPRFLNYGHYAYLAIGNSVNLNVVDINSDIIENANVIMSDNSGNIIFNTTTDASGNINEEIVYHSTMQNIPNGPTGIVEGISWEWKEQLNPLTLKITKNGYIDYENIITLNEKINWKITLNTPVYVDQNINGSIEDNNLSGTINSLELSGEITINNISGKIEED